MKRPPLEYRLVGTAMATVLATVLATAGTAATALLVRRRHHRGIGAPQRFDDLDPDRVYRVRTEEGVALHVEEVGPTGAPLTAVFVHGYALSLRSFYFQRAGLAQAFGDSLRLVFYDQRGHGKSQAGVADAATVDQLARDLRGVVDESAPAGPLLLVGHSMGGMTVLSLLGQFPELLTTGRVVGVALLSASSGALSDVTLGLPALVNRLRAPLAPVLLRGARRQAPMIEHGRRVGSELAWVITRRFSFATKTIDPAVVDFIHGILSSTRIETIADFYPSLMATDLRAVLPALAHTPVAIVGAECDLMVPPAHSRLLARALPEARLTVVARAGHLAILEQPEKVNAALFELVAHVLDEAS